MKRVKKASEAPELLAAYARQHPHDTWDHFHHRERKGYRQVKEQILRDQYGLCAYCEISIRLTEEDDEIDDFRVEHFYPKASTEVTGHNYHLDWQNMLGVCHGGSQPYVAEAKYRYSSSKEDRSCDVPKGSKEIHFGILNPLQVPARICLFKYSFFNGEMQVDEAVCRGEMRKRAAATIRELNLNAPRLMRLRKAVIDTLQDEVEALLTQGFTVETALGKLAEELLVPGEDGRYPDFFTTIRWFLGPPGEKVLERRGYSI